MENNKSGFTKRDILSHFLSAGINLTPQALNLLSAKSLTNHDLEDVIREISYFQGFKLHLTESILRKTTLFTKKMKPDLNSPLDAAPPADVIDQSDLDEEFPDESDSSTSSTSSPVKKREMTKSAENLTETPTEHDKEPFGEKSLSITLSKQTSTSSQSSGMHRFKPVAKDYAEQIQIIKDPNSDLFTSGSIEDFIAQYKDRFTRLKEVLLQNPEVKSVIPINQVNGQYSSGDVNIIGMVTDKKPARKGSTIKFSLEDLNGTIKVIVRDHERNKEAYDSMKYLLNDEVVFVSGYLQVEGENRVIFANKVTWPDIPLGNQSRIPSCPVSFALLSDLHIGSDNFLEEPFQRFVRYLKGEIGTERDHKEAGKIKYLVVCGDLVDGIGIYKDQVNELHITDIYKQYEKAAELFAQIPDYIKIIYIPGNHEPVRKAIPHPSVPPKYCQPFLDLGVTSLGDPSLVELHGVKFLLYHGDGMIDINNNIHGLPHDKPEETMKEMLRCRHLSPMYGKECTEKAPSSQDWLVIDQIPHVFHTGHMHINGLGQYRNVLLVNSGCFQKQTKFMKSLGITPTPGRVPVISEKYGKLETITLTLM